MHPTVALPAGPPPLSHMKFVQYDNMLITIINPSDVDSLPCIPMADPPHSLTGRELRHAIWVIDRCPELAYMRRRYDTEDAFLSLLHVDRKTIPVEKVEGGYALARDIRLSWERVENVLLGMSELFLANAYGAPEAKFPLDPFWPNPSDCGYRKVHKFPHHARMAAAKSLDACRVLMARCSMGIALNNLDDSASIPRWVSQLMRTKADPTWIDFIRRSVLADFSPGTRVGSYIFPSLGENGTKWVSHIPVMVRAQVPVHIVWPMQEIDKVLAHYPFLKAYHPQGGVINIPPRREGWETMFVKWSRLREQQTTSDVHSEPPALEPPCGDGQLPGETFEQFLERRATGHREREAAETPEHRERRLAREEMARQFTCPAVGSTTTVYLWVTVGDTDGNAYWEFLDMDFRKLIGRRGQLPNIWKLYTPAQKHYDSWYDQWDICARLAPNQELDPAYDHDEDEDLYNVLDQHNNAILPDVDETARPESAIPQLDAFRTDEVPTALQCHARSFMAELQGFYDWDQVGFVPYAPSAEEVFRTRYGLSAFDVVQDSSINYEAYSSIALQKMTGFFPIDLPEDAPITLCVAGFVEPLLAVNLKDMNANPATHAALWDLARSNPRHLRRPECAHPSMQICKMTLSRSVWYRVRYTTTADQDCWWELILKSGVAVIELFRQHLIQTRSDAARYLATRGMPFRTIFAPDRRAALAWRPDVRDVLGWRWPQSIYSRHDYSAYEDRVRTLLRGPKARAALLAGGIVWRLALELLGDGFLDDAAKGPSPDVYRYHDRFRPEVGDDFIDDKLSSDELDIICGTYRVVLNPGQTEDRSWWPKSTAWHQSDLDLGRWTPWCEKWFLTRLSKVRCGEEQPKKPDDWKQRLRQSNRARAHQPAENSSLDYDAADA